MLIVDLVDKPLKVIYDHDSVTTDEMLLWYFDKTEQKENEYDKFSDFIKLL